MGKEILCRVASTCKSIEIVNNGNFYGYAILLLDRREKVENGMGDIVRKIS